VRTVRPLSRVEISAELTIGSRILAGLAPGPSGRGDAGIMRA